MHRAASTGNSELCELLIEEGAEIDATDRAGQTPLMNAVICENKEVILNKFVKGWSLENVMGFYCPCVNTLTLLCPIYFVTTTYLTFLFE